MLKLFSKTENTSISFYFGREECTGELWDKYYIDQPPRKVKKGDIKQMLLDTINYVILSMAPRDQDKILSSIYYDQINDEFGCFLNVKKVQRKEVDCYVMTNHHANHAIPAYYVDIRFKYESEEVKQQVIDYLEN
jgi:hypothetical protein